METNNIGALDLPWVVFRLKQNMYTINSGLVSTILQIPKEITPVATSADIFRGITKHRGEVIPLLDMRRLLGLQPLVDEKKAAAELFADLKASHMNWLNELKRCVKAGDVFQMALDPTKCKLGKWITEITNGAEEAADERIRDVRTQISKITGIHNKFHGLGAEVMAIRRSQKSDEEIARLISEKMKELESIIPEVLRLIDGIADSFTRGHTEICIVLNDGITSVAIVVDEVVAVNELQIVKDRDTFPNMHGKDYIEGVARNDKLSGEIMVLRDSILFDSVKPLAKQAL
ncbi:hypothetical protein AGMMS49975_02960 [Clostridia bacterium]|nr:hypothetical protein AGMMS49975_02960 [Clostridia bacterium]